MGLRVRPFSFGPNEWVAILRMANVDTVKVMYSAMRAGDPSPIRALLADDVTWEHAAESKKTPWVRLHAGRDEVARALGPSGGSETCRFDVVTFFESDHVVTATVRFEVPLPDSGSGGTRMHVWEEVHHWHFDARGQISRLRQRGDTGARHRGRRPADPVGPRFGS